MLKSLAKTVAALSLILPATLAVPAWAGNSADERKCTAKHRHAKAVAAKPAAAPKPAPARGAMAVERRKPTIEILSFGP